MLCPALADTIFSARRSASRSDTGALRSSGRTRELRGSRVAGQHGWWDIWAGHPYSGMRSSAAALVEEPSASHAGPGSVCSTHTRSQLTGVRPRGRSATRACQRADPAGWFCNTTAHEATRQGKCGGHPCFVRCKTWLPRQTSAEGGSSRSGSRFDCGDRPAAAAAAPAVGSSSPAPTLQPACTAQPSHQ